MRENKLEIIRSTIIEMDKPFQLYELFEVLEEKKITDKRLILGVLNDLINSGAVSLSEIKIGEWAYKSNLISA